MPFWTNIVFLKPNLKSKFIKKKFAKNRVFLGPPQKARSPDLCLPLFLVVGLLLLTYSAPREFGVFDGREDHLCA
jgi:hypothetical protein